MFRTPTQNYNKDKPRISHLKFFGNKPVTESSDKYDRVVSLVWFYYDELNSVNYAFTVWTATADDKTWDRKKHREKALERYWKDSHYVTLKWSGEEYYFDNYTMDWFIATKLIYNKARTARYNMPSKEKFLAKYDLSWKSRLEKHIEKVKYDKSGVCDRCNSCNGYDSCNSYNSHKRYGNASINNTGIDYDNLIITIATITLPILGFLAGYSTQC